jgi:hypothetical protein
MKSRLDSQPRWELELFPLCERVIRRIIETEYDANTSGVRGLGRLSHGVPRLAGQFRKIGDPRVRGAAFEMSVAAARSALLVSAACFKQEILSANVRSPSDSELWELAVPGLLQGASTVEEAFNRELDYGLSIYALGVATGARIRTVAEVAGVRLFGLFGSQEQSKLFDRISIFHATIGFTLAASVVNLMAGTTKPATSLA